MEARNRDLSKWFSKIESGEVLLPRFQRHVAWGHREITSLLESVLRGLPTGVALTLEIGDEEPFVTRPLVGAPEPTERVTEHLLDGQQRLTALYRAFHDDYEDRAYLVGVETDDDGVKRAVVQAQLVYCKGEQRYPLWLDSPSSCWKRGLIPLRLCLPGFAAAEIKDWAKQAAHVDDDAWLIADDINRYSGLAKSFNIPFLSLPVGTPRETALDVFINLNTSSVILSSYDIVVAQYEAANNESLHDQVAELEAAVPRLASYRGAEDILLDVAALREDRTPTQASYHRLDLKQLSERFDEITKGVAFAVQVLEAESVFDYARLPTIAVFPVLAALEPHVPAGGDERGNAMALIRSYLWRSFTTSRYENSTATRVLQDVRGLIAALEGRINTAPIFDEELFPLPRVEELIRAGWPKTRQTLARAIMGASLRRGAFDLADGARATAANMSAREYHHLFPVAYLDKEGGLESGDYYRALNCSLITWRTNRSIGAKPPLVYLQERVERADLGEDEIRLRLESHLIPWNEFAVPDPDVVTAYKTFLRARAGLVANYFRELCCGSEPNG